MRTRDSVGRVKQPCPRCHDVYEQEFVLESRLDGQRIEVWHCPHDKAEDALKPCSGGSHSHVIHDSEESSRLCHTWRAPIERWQPAPETAPTQPPRY